MGPTPEQTDAIKRHVANLNDLLNDAKAVDWAQVAQLITQLVTMFISAHVK